MDVRQLARTQPRGSAPLSERDVVRLQRLGGNAATTQIVRTVQRDDAGAPAPADAEKAAPASPAGGPVGKRTGRPLADLEKEFRDLVASARGMGMNVAADNLQHFLTGKGAKRSVPLGWLRSFGVVTAAERRNQSESDRFEDQLRAQAKKVPDGGSATFADHWDARISAWMSTELFYASGISQLSSAGTFTLTRTGSTVAIAGTVQQRWFDPYNWNPGSSALIPGHGSVSDDVGLDLKDAGIGADYLLENLYTQTLSATYTIQPFYRPDTATFVWSGP